MKMFKSKNILSIILATLLVLQNINCFYAEENIKFNGSKEEENVIVDEDIEAIYEESKNIIIGKLQDDGEIGELKDSINNEFKYVEGEVLVCKKNENTGLLFGSGNDSYDEFDDLLNNGKTIYNFEEKNDIKLFGSINNENEGNNAENNDKSVIHIKSNKYSTKELIENLSKRTDVYIVEPNYVIDVNDINNNEVYGFSDTEYSDINLTNLQFDKSNINDEFHKYSVKVPNWNVMPKEDSKNSDGVVVAVIDTGIDYEHPDLKNVMWDEGLNYPTLTALGGGKYGICTVADSVSQEIMDENGHGTHCSGIIAAEWNNMGVSGVCNGVKIMGVKAGSASGLFDTSRAVMGYNYIIIAKKANVNVVAISCSWGGSAYSFILKEVIKEAEKYNIASIFASGNESVDLDLNNYICKCSKYIPGAIVVNSSTVKGGMSSFSNYGKSYTDVAAPGSDILSTIPRNLSVFNTKLIPDKYLKLFKNDGSSTDLFNLNDVATSSSVLSLDRVDTGELSTMLINGDEANAQIRFNRLNISSDDFDRENVKLALNLMGINFLNPLEKIKVSLYIPCVNVLDASDKKDISLANVGSKIVGPNSYITVYMPIHKNYVYEVDGKQYKPDISLGNNFYCKLDFGLDEEKVGFYIFVLKDIGVVDSKPVPYDYMSGTSMACPQVSGAVAVIATRYPSETPAKWIARIKGSIYSGATSQSLIEEDSKLITSDTSVTAGLVSLEKALQNDTTSFNPILNTISFEDNKYVLKGFFFGSSGQIKIKGVDYTTNVSFWSDEKIILDIDSSVDISGTNIYIEVKNEYNKIGHQYIDIEKNEYIYNTKDIKSIPVTEGSIIEMGIFENVVTVNNKTYMLSRIKPGDNSKIYSFSSFDNASGVFCTDGAFNFSSYNMLDLKNFVYVNNKLYFVCAMEEETALKNHCMVYNINNKNGDFVDIDDSVLSDNIINNSALYYDEKSNRIYLFAGELISRDSANKTASKKIYILDLNENKILPFDEELSIERANPYISRPVKNKYGMIYFYIAGRESSVIDRVEFLPNGEINIKKDYANIPDYDDILTDTTSYVEYIPIEHGFYVASITREKDGRKYNNYKLDIENKKLTYDGYIRDAKCEKICGWTYNNTGNILSYTENGVSSLMYSYFPYSRIIAPDEIQNEIKAKYSGGGGGGGSGNFVSNNATFESDPIKDKPILSPDKQKSTFMLDKQLIKWIYDPIKNTWGMDVTIDGITVPYKYGFAMIDYHTYYFDENGIMATGWVKDVNGDYYAFEWQNNSNYGMMLYGWRKINDKWHYFNIDGKLAVNTITPDGYIVNFEGAWEDK